MKLAIINDTHWGARNDNQVFYEYTKKFLDEVFFPYVDEHNIKRIFHLGDLVDRRKYINFNTAYHLRHDLILPILNRDLRCDIIVGNHDVYFKNTNYVNALAELAINRYDKFRIYSVPAEIDVDGIPILLVPWITQDNLEATFEKIQSTKAQICFGHLDINGFEKQRGVIQFDGLEPEFFQKFDIVLTGHFHHRNSKDNIHYLGAPLQFDWNDYDDTKGFHVFDTETRKLEFIENPFVIFKKIWYNDKAKTVNEVIANFNFEDYCGCFCKVIIEEKTNPYFFDLFVEKLEEAGVSDLRVVEDHHNIVDEGDDDIAAESEDTFTVFRNAIEGMSGDIDKDMLLQTITELYNEAQELE